MKRLVIYTCITGAYEELKDPLSVDGSVDYVCFTDNEELCGSVRGVWKFLPVPFIGRTPAETSRYCKLRPHLLFPEYEYSLWMDGNVTIADSGLYSRLNEMMDGGVLAAGLKHGSRDDIYDEAYRILYGRRERLLPVMKTVKFLRRSGMPRHFGLYENNVIFRRHSSPEVVAFDEMWWNMFLRLCGRDQLSHTFCLWKTGLKYDLLLPDGANARNHPYFRYFEHRSKYLKDKSLKGRMKDASTAFDKLVFKAWAMFFLD